MNGGGDGRPRLGKARSDGGASIGHRRRYGPITGPQLIMLALLDDGPQDDSVGLEAETLNAPQIAVCERLVGRDLVRFDIGWRYSCWFRLTAAGRDALRETLGSSGRAWRHARSDKDGLHGQT